MIVILLWTVAAFLGNELWMLWKTYGSFRQTLKKLPERIRSRLGAVGVRELKNIEENFYRLVQKVHFRKVLGTTAEKFSQQFQECFQKVELSVYCLGPFYGTLSAVDGYVPHPGQSCGKAFGLRSAILFGIRREWCQMKMSRMFKSKPSYMVQRPFGRGCLKRLVGMNRIQISGVTAQSHNCGLPLSLHGLDYPEMPLGDLKRMVEDMLVDRKVRTSRNLQC